VTTSDITIPEIGGPLTLGASYNSLLVNSGVSTGEMDAYGWRQREGADIQLYPASSDGSVTYLGEEGTAGKFTAPTGSGHVYGSPAQFHATLTNSPDSTCSRSAYELTWHQTGEKMCFTSGGILTSEADRNGNTNTFTYNASHLESQVAYTPDGASAPTRTVTVNNNGYWLEGFTWSGGTAGTKTVTYTPSASPGNLTSVQQADGTTVSFGYDGSHDLTSIENGDSLTTTLAYNSAHQVTSVTQQTTGTGTATTRFDYVSATETQVADPNTNQADDHELNKITPVTGSSLQPETITYDGFGRVATVTNGAGDTVTYTYDLADRVAKAAYTGAGQAVTVTYAYDGAGNLHTQTDPSGTTTYGYNGQNLVTSITATSGGGTRAYAYDGDGNLTSAQNANGTTAYSYNDLNEVTSLTDPAGNLWEFAYDADGRRTTEWFDTTATESNWQAKISTSYDLSGRISEIKAQEHSASPSTVSDVSYCYSPYVTGQSCPAAGAATDTSLLQWSENNQTSTVSQYTYDQANELTKATNIGANGTLTYNDAGQMTAASATHNGAASLTYAGATQDEILSDGSASTALVNTGGTTAGSYTYDPYGNLIAHSGGEADANLILYTGALNDDSYKNIAGIPGTGYNSDGQRWQDPATGTFTQPDTLNQLGNPANGNRYAYAGSDPANYIDPTGRSVYSCIEAVGLGITGGLVAIGSAIFGLGTGVTGAGAVLAVVGFYFGLGSFITGVNDVANGACG
jgi:RHS repeat-associated protein